MTVYDFVGGAINMDLGNPDESQKEVRLLFLVGGRAEVLELKFDVELDGGFAMGCGLGRVGI
jgi:hypothetical protein